MSEILIKVSKEALLEILKQIPPDELDEITDELKPSKSSLQQQVERARARVKPFSVATSPFFSLLPVDIGPTSAGELDRIIAEEADKIG
jgi:hypothetical protein